MGADLLGEVPGHRYTGPRGLGYIFPYLHVDRDRVLTPNVAPVSCARAHAEFDEKRKGFLDVVCPYPKCGHRLSDEDWGKVPPPPPPAAASRRGVFHSTAHTHTHTPHARHDTR